MTQGPLVSRYLGLFPLLLAAPALAQPDDPAEIVITGRGLTVGVGDEPYDSVIIDRDRLQGSASHRLEDVLRDVPGFQLFRRSDARSANPTSQGATLRGLGGNASSRAILLLDGVPQTDPFGGWISWPAFDPRRLDRVRVTRGGGSGASGPGALAGTIELDSATPADLAGLSGSIAYGSRESVDGFASAGTALGEGYVSATTSFAAGDGFVPIVKAQRGAADRASPYRQFSVAARAVVPLSATVELQTNLLTFDDRRERGTAFSAIGTQGTDASLRLVGRGRWQWSVLGYGQLRDFRNSFASVDGARTAATRVSDQYNVPSIGSGARFELRPPVGEGLEARIGADWRMTEGRSQEFFAYAGGQPTRRRIAGGRSHTAGAFAELAASLGALTLSGGARLDRWLIRDGLLDERVIASQASITDLAFADRSGWEPTGRAGLAWKPGAGFSLRGAGYLGWRLPTLNELYRPFRVGADATAANAGLAPERLRGADLGVDYRPARGTRLSVTIFDNRLRGAIANVTLGQGPGTFPGVGFVAPGGQFRQRQNLDAIRSRGLEIDAAMTLGRFALSGGYSYVAARVESAGPALPLDGLRPAQTPKHSLAATMAWRDRHDALASISVRYVGGQFEDDLNRQRLPGAVTLDAVANVPIGPRFAVQARVENLTDRQVVTAISGAGLVERATPRTIWIGVTLKGPDGR